MESLVGIDLSQGMLREARARADALGLARSLALREMDVEALAFPDASFDTVLDSYSLCVFSNPVQAVPPPASPPHPRRAAGSLRVGGRRSSFARCGVCASPGGGCCCWRTP